MSKMPPFKITPRILSLSHEIGCQLGFLHGAKLYPISIHLRRDNKIKTIQSSLAIEGNNLSIKQITAISQGKRIIGEAREVLEVKNAIQVYEKLSGWDPLSINAFKDAHRELMQGLITTNGEWRKKGVGVFKGKTLAHMAPPAKRVGELMDNLFEFINNNDDIPWLIKACVFHYELEFTHPFEDGNGRMGRLWQQLLLMKENAVFEFISVEAAIKENQQQYYDVLGVCDRAGESTEFIMFSLEQILTTLKQYTDSVSSQIILPQDRLNYAALYLSDQWFCRKDYMLQHKDISSATASRDLAFGVEKKLLRKKDNNNKTSYQFVME